MRNPEEHAALELQGVGLCYLRPGRFMFAASRPLRRCREIWALQDVNFRLEKGETLGVIGRNGSGKSTLAMVCAGVLPPDRGAIRRSGTVQLLSLGLGFQNELSGRENVYISGALLGLKRGHIAAHMEEILEFTELGDFLDEPVRIYSGGMRSRLGFAVATMVQPDVLILDEVMATGDEAFRAKAVERMSAMRSRAGSVMVVSHSSSQVRSICDRVLWLEQGRLLRLDETASVLSAYSEFCKNPAQWLQENTPGPPDCNA